MNYLVEYIDKEREVRVDSFRVLSRSQIEKSSWILYIDISETRSTSSASEQITTSTTSPSNNAYYFLHKTTSNSK